MSAERRTTARSTAGVPPLRYGDPIDTTGTQRHRSGDRSAFNDTAVVNHCDTTANNMDSSADHTPQDSENVSSETRNQRGSQQGTTRSSSATSGTIHQKEVEIAAKKKIHQLEREYDAKELALTKMDRFITTYKHKMEHLQIQYSAKDCDPNHQNILRETIEPMKIHLREKQDEYEEAKLDLEYEAKELARKRQELLDDVDLENLRIQEEEEQRKLILEKDQDIQNWRAQSIEQNRNGDPIVESDPTLPEENLLVTPDLLEKLRKLQQSNPWSSNDPVIFQTGTTNMTTGTGPTTIFAPTSAIGDGGNSTTATPQAPIDDIARVISEALRRVNSAPGSSNAQDTSTLLARQVQGRDLPTFSGLPEEWPAFAAAYASSTKNCRYTNADNLARLQKALKGDAKKMVQWLLINPDSVPAVINDLQKRYGNPTVIINSLIARAREVPPVKMDKIESFIEYGVAVRNLASTIVALGENDHLCNPSLLQELIKKLPLTKQMEWTKLAVGIMPKPTLENFAEWIKIETETAYLLCPASTSANSREPRDRRQRRNSDRVYQAKEDDNKSSNEKRKKCGCCYKEGHRINECSSYKSKTNDDKWKLVREKRLCFSCLLFGHQSNKCRSRRSCGIDGCKQSHHRLLHNKAAAPKNKPEEIKSAQISASDEEEIPSDPNQSSSWESVTHAVHSVGKSDGQINVGVLPVVIRGPKGSIATFAELDTGATLTVMDASIAKKLGLKGEETTLKVHGFQSTTVVNLSQSVELEIGPHDGSKFHKIKAKTVPKLKLNPQTVRQGVLRRWNHLKDVPIQPYENAMPTILIGLDNSQMLTPRNVRSTHGKGNSPFAMETTLGWVLLGPLGTGCNKLFSCHHLREDIADPLHQLVKEQFLTESLGILPNLQKPRSRDDIRAQAILDQTVRRITNGWETGLLWKDNNPSLPASKANAMRRLVTMERKMDRDPKFAEAYQSKIQEYLNKGYARVLKKEEIQVDNKKEFYLPHFMAVNPKKPGKLRFVFDAAARTSGSCLNDHLLQGPDKMTSLLGALMKFRQRQIGLTADIQDMFHRVRVRSDDATAQRFLWRGMNRERDPDILQMDVLIFGASCSPVCASEAKNRNALLWKDEFPSAYEAIVNRHYVDDYLDSCDTVSESVQRYREVTEVHSRGNFRICNWLSNSTALLSAISDDNKCKMAKAMEFMDNKTDSYDVERVLGLFWQPKADHFTFSLTYLKAKEDILRGIKIPTKREMLSLVMSVYDPLGFISILTIRARIILQATWRTKTDWNDRIPMELHSIWKQWIMELSSITTFRLPRCYSSMFSSSDSNELHVFGDASEDAMGTVAYLRIKKGDQVSTALVMSRAKVAPMKAISIPRLELQAAVIGSRLAKFIRDEHEVSIQRLVFWTDSQAVVSWIRNDSRRFQQFVSHRIGEIHELTDVSQWRWLPTSENVADELTRIQKPCDWTKSSRWINGPEFLLLPEDQWPSEPVKMKSNQELLELKPSQIFRAREIIPIMDISRFSSFGKLLRTTAYVLKFILRKWGPIDLDDIRRSRIYWIRMAQEECFKEEKIALKKNLPLSKSSRLFKLSPYIDEDDLIRIKGRIDNAFELLPLNARRPILMDPSHPVTTKMLDDFHRRCGHHGFEKTINEIRQHYYVIHIRAAVKKTKQNCQVCKNASSKPITPEMGQLPKFRVAGFLPPFASTGVDYFGPKEVIVKRSREKRYGVLFTCLATRAIHLEIAGSLSTDSCIMAIRRFVSRRGPIAELHSDNGTNFHGADNELREALKELDQDLITNYCISHGIQWSFIPPAAPHMGGSWERMVKSVKIALGAVLQQKHLSEEVLYTLLTEAEHTVNSHPLTHVPDDPDDPEALTPNHFLIHRSSNMQPIGAFGPEDLSGRKQWRIVQRLADCFWRRWVREYLPTLLRRTKWNQVTRPIKVGDIVLEVDPNLPRNTWPKGIVVMTYPGKDGTIRVVDIKLGRNGHIHKRPVSKLCILDVEPHGKQDVEDQGDQDNKTAPKKAIVTEFQ